MEKKIEPCESGVFCFWGMAKENYFCVIMAEKDLKLNLTLTKVQFKGFKSIEDLSVDLEKGLNILIGKNASGKSNFLECLYLSMAYRKRRQPAFFKYANLEFISSDGSSFIWESERDVQKLNTEKENIEEGIRIKEKLFINNTLVFDSSATGKRELINYKNKKILPLPAGVRGILRRIGHFRITPYFIKFNLPNDLDCISIPGLIRIPIEGERFDIWNFPNTLDFLFEIFLNAENYFISHFDEIKNINKTTFIEQLIIKNEIINNLKKYTPIQDIRFNKNINVYKEDKLITIENIKLDFKINNSWIPWSSLSDGTRRLFYLVAEISNKENGFVLVEEPELGIHPHQFHLIMEFLKEESQEKQIIISTHSPQALNYFKEDELSHILITNYDQEKSTQIRHLTNAEIKKAKTYIKEVGFLSDYWMLSDLEL